MAMSKWFISLQIGSKWSLWIKFKKKNHQKCLDTIFLFSFWIGFLGLDWIYFTNKILKSIYIYL